jgi:iron(II)-dependent oxidoreductase
MVYKHKYFTLNTKSRQVFDEHGKKLRITGNAYLMLEFLCKEKHGTVTDIGDVLDRVGKKRSKDETRVIMGYTEDDLRQLKYKINSLVGHEIVKYQNHIYSLEGEVKEEKFLSKRKIYFVVIFVFFTVTIGFSAIIAQPSLFVKKPESEMVFIPAGEFIIGSDEKEINEAFEFCLAEEESYCEKEDYLAEYPKRKIWLDDFYIDKKEVSNKEYEMFLKATKRNPPPFWKDSNLNSPNQPVVGVTFEEAQAYCKWLGKRLPTEEEWEKAARGQDGRKWPWGNEWDGSKLNHGQRGLPGYDESDGYKYSAPVGTNLGESPYGVLNMAGNVSEWVESDFSPYPGNDKFSHSKYNLGYKIVRGGSYVYTKADTRTSFRNPELPETRDYDIGFRCAKSK